MADHDLCMAILLTTYDGTIHTFETSGDVIIVEYLCRPNQVCKSKENSVSEGVDLARLAEKLTIKF